AFVNVLDVTNPLGFSFGSPTYGTFAISSVLENSIIPGISRTYAVEGTFTPGPATFGAGFDPTPAALTITINQAAPGVLSASATLAATSAVVPEPSTIVLLATFGIPLIVIGLRQQRG